jgi:hypothetical protein
VSRFLTLIVKSLINLDLAIVADTQKVLQFPKLQLKEAYFSLRIGVTNFTVAQVGENSKVICFVTHDA